MKIKGRVWKYGNNVNTDEIIPALYLSTSDPEQLGAHCMEGIDRDFVKKVRRGDLIVAGKNFGCGSSREHAPVAIKAAGAAGVIASSFARIFYRNSFNIGLPIFECVSAVKGAREGDVIEIDMAKGEIRNLSRGKEYRIKPFPDFMRDLIRQGGLVNWIRKNPGQRKGKGKKR